MLEHKSIAADVAAFLQEKLAGHAVDIDDVPRWSPP
jgi:hypothetical protein